MTADQKMERLAAIEAQQPPAYLTPAQWRAGRKPMPALRPVTSAGRVPCR